MDKERPKGLSFKKIFAWIGVVGTMVILGACLIRFTYHYPSDSLSNYPNTQWKCDQLGLELFVDASGNITGIYKNNAEIILLDATACASTKSGVNYMLCHDQVSKDQMLYMICFYTDIDQDVFYVQVDSRIPTMEVNTSWNFMRYKFIKQQKTGDGSVVPKTQSIDSK